MSTFKTKTIEVDGGTITRSVSPVTGHILWTAYDLDGQFVRTRDKGRLLRTAKAALTRHLADLTRVGWVYRGYRIEQAMEEDGYTWDGTYNLLEAACDGNWWGVDNTGTVREAMALIDGWLREKASQADARRAQACARRAVIEKAVSKPYARVDTGDGIRRFDDPEELLAAYPAPRYAFEGDEITDAEQDGMVVAMLLPMTPEFQERVDEELEAAGRVCPACGCDEVCPACGAARDDERAYCEEEGLDYEPPGFRWAEDYTHADYLADTADDIISDGGRR